MKEVLEILIPTYNRPESAKAAIESVLACDDDRLTVRCNSNGFEPSLEKYRDNYARVNYDSFESNKGPNSNIKKLFNESNAKFCMLLSDEDRVNCEEYKNILNFLENLDESTQVIACSVFDKLKSNYYWKPSSKISCCSIHNYVALSPLSTYMTGFIYRVESLKALNISELMNKSTGNAYVHLDVTLYMLQKGKLEFFKDRFVEKGADIEYGGDGYSHKVKELSSNVSDIENMDLNPNVYGTKARVRQFCYRESLLHKLKSHIGFISFCIGKLNYIDFFYKSIMRVDKLVLMQENTALKSEIVSALADSKANNEFSGSASSYIFIFLISFPRFITHPLFLIISNLNKLILKIYALHLYCFQKE